MATFLHNSSFLKSKKINTHVTVPSQFDFLSDKLPCASKRRPAKREADKNKKIKPEIHPRKHTLVFLEFL